jgi:GTPase
VSSAKGVSNPPAHRSGFATFVGRPNVGKSTLTNALVGEKVAITSSKPQTTRRAIRGVVHAPSGQLIIVDTPGIHRPRTLLGQRLNDVVTNTLGDVDVIGFCMPADEKIGPGDRFINESLDAFPRAKKVAIVTKIDTVSKNTVGERLLAVSQLRDWEAIVPVSATSRIQLDVLLGALIELLPAGPSLYPDDAVTDETLEGRIAELIREAALEGVSDELPHSLAVTIDDMVERDDKDLLEIYANLWVERDSQKGIVIGHRGARLQDVGARARGGIEALVGRQVFLSMRVKVAKEWQRDPKQLGRLGF